MASVSYLYDDLGADFFFCLFVWGGGGAGGIQASHRSAEWQTGASDWSAGSQKNEMCCNSTSWGGLKTHLDEVQ